MFLICFYMQGVQKEVESGKRSKESRAVVFK
jgi:hypothetical protein